jgi:hypothetical protein
MPDEIVAASPERSTSVRVSYRTAGRIRKMIHVMQESDRAQPTANEIVSAALDALSRERAVQQNNTELLDFIAEEVSS